MKMLKIIKIARFSELNINEIVQLLNDDYIGVVVIETNNSFMINECTPYLNKNQIENMFKYKKENDRINYAVTKTIVNLLFSRIEKIKYQEIRWQYGKYNKPYIENKGKIKFNISHTKGCSIVTFSRNNIGVDIENLKRNIDYSEIKNNFFMNSEKILTLNDFYKHWVSKEAYLKYKGVGLTQSLESVVVVDESDNVVKIIDRENNVKKEILIFEKENFIFAICF
ncbi:4'-phosphopantetheinyl transferase family protein [Fusobacterium necrophorum]|uniref:4'-phosphopantetheinyl transferase family protein n=1 Tax=Fusobacterium necrophorum TaxID=859 RepID=UPI00254EBF07|nr:4'-phosphopantetheinyl transferase superfamily protein [Fusobacterium necrophorum]